MEWQERGGLEPPEKVRAAGREYRQESDPLEAFFAECCDISPNDEVEKSKLWETYRVWGQGSGIRFLLGSKGFSQELMRRRFDHYRETAGARRQFWIGLELDQDSVENLKDSIRDLKEALNPKS